MKPIHLAFFILAASASALGLAPGIYSISVIGDDSLCLGYYLAYNEGAGTDVYLIPSDTSQPPLWNVNPGPDGTFVLAPVNRTVPTFAPEMLAYNIVSCSEATVSLNYNPNATWANAGGFLNAAKRECPPGSAVTLAPLKTTGAGSCFAVGLVPTTATNPNSSPMLWHFSPYPNSPVELITKAYGNKPMEVYDPWIAMDSTLILTGGYYSYIPQPAYWRRTAGGVWRRGTMNLTTVRDAMMQVAIGKSFVAVSLSVSGTNPIARTQRVYVYRRGNLVGAPTATLDFYANVGNPGFYLAAGGSTLAVASYPNKTDIFSVDNKGKLGEPTTLAVPYPSTGIEMSRDGRTLALTFFKNGGNPNGDINELIAVVLVFRQAREGGPWVREAEIQPPKTEPSQDAHPMIALTGENLALSYNEHPTKLHFYRRSARGTWKLVQSVVPPGWISHMVGDGDNVVVSSEDSDANQQILIFKRCKATGRWTSRKASHLPSWNDDIVEGVSYGTAAMYGKRLALTATFKCYIQNKGSQNISPSLIYIYDDINNL